MDGHNDAGNGSGSALNPIILIVAGVCTAFTTCVSAMSIYLHLRNYRRPFLQRMVIRILIMVPIYSIASLISLFSLEAAFVIDAIRDIYEAFVIYCFFNLLLGYLGGERSLLILLHGREPIDAVFPASLFRREFDVSDPYMFLFLKRGILQYVQLKPILAISALILKAVGKYNEGDLRAGSGYLYISIVYNLSIFLSLYCLAVFWMCVHQDLKPFRPVPKFLSVKGILFFSFWQSTLVSILVASGAITSLGPYTDSEHIALGLSDVLISFEMPFFAIAHMYAFSHTDYIDNHTTYAGRMPMWYAFRDAFGIRDVIEDAKQTIRGEGMDYREFEPAEGMIHQGSGRDRRIKAGLRYAQGGQKKYWLPMPADAQEVPHPRREALSRTIYKIMGREQEEEEIYAPLLEDEARDVLHTANDLRNRHEEELISEWEGYELPFGDPDPEEDQLFIQSKNYVFGDYMYPCIDVSSEHARKVMWVEEERVLRDERGAYFSPITGARGLKARNSAVPNYGALSQSQPGGEGSSLIVQVPPNPAVIDREHDRLPDPEQGLRLGWSKQKRRSERGESFQSQIQKKKSSPLLHPVPISRADSNSSHSSKHSTPPAVRHEIRSDAVDLVVEDEPAAQEELTRERRRGEPAILGSDMRKVYKRGIFSPERPATDSDGENTTRSNAEEESSASPAQKSLSVDRDQLLETVIETRDAEIVARAVTPPTYAQGHASRSHNIPDDENPWA